MYKREQIIRLWFNMWLKKRDLGIEKIFDKAAVYIESYGPMYESTDDIKRWFNDWNKENTVLIWNVKDFWHNDNSTIVSWYFKCEFNHKIDAFDGISEIVWHDDKIKILKEYACKLPNYNPYKEKKGLDNI